MEQITSSMGRGGRRDGAGRKAVDESEKKVSVTFAVSSVHKAKIQAAAKEAGLSTSEFLARMIDTLE